MVRDIARQQRRRGDFRGGIRRGFRGGLVVALGAVAITAAGCSPETARFGGSDPYANPYANANPRGARAYSSYSSPPPAAAPPPARYTAFESESLPEPGYAPPSHSSPAYASPPYGSPAYGAIEYDQSAGMPAPPRAVPYAPPSPPPPRYEPPRPAAAPPGPGTPASAPAGGAKLADAAAPRTPSPPPATRVAAADPGAPVFASSRGPAASKEAAGTVPAVPAGSGQTLLPVPPVYTVAHGDTLGWVAHHYHVSAREIAVANGLSPDAPLRVGMRLTIPLRTPTVAQTRPADPHLPPPARAAAADPPLAANVHVATPVEPPAAAAINGAPAFRWPARGRIVNNYGARVNGSTNDGIDLAVPEGTPVRSADDGVVAYAGNELKGYGNLVLVRHADGFVTAYANGSELLVKRNDQVHKGQVIMKSGQTGNAAAPQLHFEIRKNSAPVDPAQYLPADKSASAPL
jgi:murein DD-endopeptidase MepM/ murein hydrolase activator NlpD